MKVAINTRLLLKNRMEGIARFIFESTKRLVLDHPEIDFHFFFDRPYDKQFVFADNVTPHIINPPSRHPILWYIWFEHFVPRALNNLKIDVFLSGDMYMSLKTDVPTILVSHDLNYIHYPKGLKWSHRKFLEYYFPKYHRAAHHIVAVSNYTKKDIIDQFSIDKDKISVAYNSAPEDFKVLDEEMKKEVRAKHTFGQPYFIYIGSLHPRKNLESLLKAFDLFKAKSHSEFKLVVFGRIAFKTSSIFKVYEGLKHKEDVIFLNESNAIIYDLLGAAHALCYISLFEGFGIPILEAFQAEVPVITSNVSSMPEVAGDAALLVDPLNIPDIVNALLRISDSDALKEDLILKGRKRRLAFSWEQSSKIIYQVIEQVHLQNQKK